MQKLVNALGLAGGILAGLLTLTSNAAAIEITFADVWEHGLYGGVARLVSDTTNHRLIGTASMAGSIVTIGDDGSILNSLQICESPGAVAAVPGFLFVCDGRGVAKIAGDGTPLFSVGGSDTFFVGPHDIAVANDGRIYVADRDNRIKVFDANGSYLMQFGGTGWFNGRLDAPVALAINNERGELVVADQNNHRIQVYNLNGDSLRRWGQHGNGDFTPGDFLRLWGIDIDGQGRIWCYDAILDVINVYDPLGSLLFSCHLVVPGFRGGIDIALVGSQLFVAAPAEESIYVFDIQETVEPWEDTPFELTASVAEDGMHLRWNTIPVAESYRIFRSSSPLFEGQYTVELGQTPLTTFTDTQALNVLDMAFYRVEAQFGPGVCNAPIFPPEGPNTFDSNGDSPTLEHHDGPHDVYSNIQCNTCHFTHFAYPNPLPAWWFGDHTCRTCHVESGMAQTAQNHLTTAGTMYCTTCHSPHFQQDVYPHNYLRDAVLTPHSGWRSTAFTGPGDFVHGAPAYDGICEICHTQTDYYRNNASGGHDHHAGANCTACHAHTHGFAAQP